MKRYIKILFATIGAMDIMSSTALAGQWVENGGNWFYMTDDGIFAKDTWLWLDENHDSRAELYHFDANGVMSKGTTIGISDRSGNIQVNIDEDGATTDYTYSYVCYKPNYSHTSHIKSTETNHSPMEKEALPPCYSINIDTEGKYIYSSNVDHYDFKEIDTAWIYSIDENEDCYSAEVYLIVYHGGSDPGVFENFECKVKTTAKFAKNCKIKTYVGDTTSTSMSSFLRNNHYFNYLIVDSVDSDGYITKCTITGVE